METDEVNGYSVQHSNKGIRDLYKFSISFIEGSDTALSILETTQ